MVERMVCTKLEPCDKTKGKFYQHPDAFYDGECLQDCCERYRCPYCDYSWLEELPQ